MHPPPHPNHHFRIAARDFEWHEVPDSDGRLIDVTSGNFHIRVVVGDPPYTWLGPIAVLGTECPPGVPASDGPYLIDAIERDRHGLVHTELIRSLVGRVARRRRHRRRMPLNDHWRERMRLPKTQYPKSNAEREARQQAEEEKRIRSEAIAAKDALITDKRCPFCGKPCPSYRITCKHCGQQIRARRTDSSSQ